MYLAEGIATVRASIECRYVADGTPARSHGLYIFEEKSWPFKRRGKAIKGIIMMEVK